jgi:CheY-like chemotaxis protein
MGGQLSVDSRPGEGSTFRVEFSLQKAPPGPGRGDGPAAASGDSAGPRARVLVAEDDRVGQMVAEGMLTMLGCEVEVRGDGAAACAAAAAGDFDLIFMDCHMPVMDGYQATQQIRHEEGRRDRRTPIVALTADSLASDRERCLASGMDDFLTKPVSSAQLAASIERWTRRRMRPTTRW